jgi:signal-transduction protein with cAMP-binding, CBS, and nucleotidyltransferase domain
LALIRVRRVSGRIVCSRTDPPAHAAHAAGMLNPNLLRPRISELMTSPVHTVGMDDCVQQVEIKMNLHHVTSVPVVDDKGSVFGIISSPDLIHFHETHKNALSVRAWEMCTFKPVAVPFDAEVEEVANLMVSHRIHHIVITKHGSLVGIVSSLDFVKDYLKHVH